MNTDDTQTTSGERMRLLDELQSLLEKQLQLAHQGASANEQFGALTDRAGVLVERIRRLGVAGSGECHHKLERLRQLYKALSLALTAEKAGVCEELSRLRKGRRTLGVYRTNA